MIAAKEVMDIVYRALSDEQEGKLPLQETIAVGILNPQRTTIYLEIEQRLTALASADGDFRAKVVTLDVKADRALSLEFQQGVDAANCGAMKRTNPYFIGDTNQRERDDWNRGWDETTAPIKAECLRLIESPDGGKIFAIRYLRGKLSLSLKEAKDWVEAMEVPPVTPIQIQWRIFDLNLQAMKALEQAIALQTQLRVVGI